MVYKPESLYSSSTVIFPVIKDNTWVGTVQKSDRTKERRIKRAT